MFCTGCGAKVTNVQRFCTQCGLALVPATGPATEVHRVSSLQTFWRRLTNGITLGQLWKQFENEARVSYRVYSQEIKEKKDVPTTGFAHVRYMAKSLFWAMMMKLSPGRRVLLFFALVLLFIQGIRLLGNDGVAAGPNLAFAAGVILFVLLALELADRVSMKRDLEIARDIQSWLMPASAPEGTGLDIAFATRPANTVAGDYYDAFFCPGNPGCDHRLILAVADVAGKSVPAALLMATLQASLRTLAAVSPGVTDLVSGLNRYACAQNLGGQRFTTAFIGEWQPESRIFKYVNAGHNWPVLRRRTGEVERLQTGGIPLGITSAAAYETGRVVLEPGDVLLIFTDGIVEAENTQEQEFGESRMLTCFSSCCDLPAPAVLKQLMLSVDNFVGIAPQHDDMTCLVVRHAAVTHAAPGIPAAQTQETTEAAAV